MAAEEQLTIAEKLEILEIYKHFPQKSAACMEALKVIQKHRRWVSDPAVKELGLLLDMSPAAIDSIATYYNLIFRRPVYPIIHSLPGHLRSCSGHDHRRRLAPGPGNGQNRRNPESLRIELCKDH